MACVLVVDNDGATREPLAEILGDDGYVVHLVASGEDAVAHLGEETPAVILLDTWMSRMSERDFLDWLAQEHRFDGVPVILATSDSYRLDHRRVSLVLEKPYDVEWLLAVVRKYCG